ncbi:M14 family metallopeptidase [Pseudomonas turukhanskensis]|uniref:DUF2817 domain-containing protein n=1 Tax=Pseudomonas turukhanskensis TaxID=1806536 RepID=A0A9W6K2C6_9PSED|nr:M14 family metallopeptidase [Pseudomonas turukhanskensis]GLK86946.1 hypothetical protein GCM10017655_00080 [Pseudomonas turukhanskensis]
MNPSCFSQSYTQARQQFLNSCARRGLAVESHIHPLPGRDGEQLAIDVAFHGKPDAANLLVLSSGCHGVEGFCGSGVQVDRLNDDAWFAATQRDDLAVLYIHALNPYGFSHLRRVTNENVDLNRNFIDFSQPLPDNAEYRALAPVLLPKKWPVGALNALQLMSFALRYGRMGLQAGISRGQHSDPKGLFFAGTAPTWSNQRLREILRTYGQRCQRLAWVDVHTGLGPRGHGERIYKGLQNAEDIARCRRWFGDQVTNAAEGNSASADLNGTIDLGVMAECPQAQYTGVTLEYGTLPGKQVLSALRAEQWLYNHPEAPLAQHQQIKQQIRDAFYVDADDWKIQVLEQARDVMAQGLAGLYS